MSNLSKIYLTLENQPLISTLLTSINLSLDLLQQKSHYAQKINKF